MLELQNIAAIVSGLAVREKHGGRARVMRLSDLSDLKAGRIPALAIGDVPDVARALAIESGDLIVAARGLATDVLLASDPVLGAYISIDLYLIRPDKTKVHPEYLFAFLRLPATRSFFAAGKQGSGLTRLPKEALERITVPLPALDTQRLIAGLANALEEEIGLRKRLSDLNSVLAREIVARAFSTATATNSERSVT